MEPWFSLILAETTSFGRAKVQLFGRARFHTCNFGLDQTEKSESPDQTRQVWKGSKCISLIKATTHP